jgi:hypothetical protein
VSGKGICGFALSLEAGVARGIGGVSTIGIPGAPRGGALIRKDSYFRDTSRVKRRTISSHPLDLDTSGSAIPDQASRTAGAMPR